MTDAYQQIIDTLARCRRVLITTHVRPDGDAIGTTAALSLGLKKVNIDSEVLLLSHLPRKYAFVFHDHAIPYRDVENGWEGSRVRVQEPTRGEQNRDRYGFSSEKDRDTEENRDRYGLSSGPEPGSPTPEPFLHRFDALLVADTGTWSQLPGLQERVANWPVPKIVLDHHLTQEDWADLKLVIPDAAAAGEIAAELLELWEIPLDPAIASALYVAIASDTGWFQFANTRPFTMRLAATLMEAGVDTDRLYQLLYQNERAERVLLQCRALQSMQLLADGRLAVMAITKQDFADTAAAVPDTENLINIPLQIRTVQVVVLLVEPPDFGPVRVSFRSKGHVDVARFAEQFAGGGHARAAGAKLDAPLNAARESVVRALLQQFPVS